MRSLAAYTCTVTARGISLPYFILGMFVVFALCCGRGTLVDKAERGQVG